VALADDQVCFGKDLVKVALFPQTKMPSIDSIGLVGAEAPPNHDAHHDENLTT
jgi:hypothetical protein